MPKHCWCSCCFRAHLITVTERHHSVVLQIWPEQKLQTQKYLGRHGLPWPLIKSAYGARLYNGLLYAIGPLSILSRLCYLSVCGVGVLWPNGWMDQDETWHGGRPRLRPHCVRWGPSSAPLEKRGHPAQFSAHVYCGQTVAHLIYCSALVSNAGFAFCGCNMTFYGPPEHTSRGASGASLGRGLVGHCTCGHPLNPPMMKSETKNVFKRHRKVRRL